MKPATALPPLLPPTSWSSTAAVLVPTIHTTRWPIPPPWKFVGHAFPGRKIVGIDASILIRQHGSLHCVTMQLPKGLLA